MVKALSLFADSDLKRALLSLLHRCKSMSDLKKTHALLITLGLSHDQPLSSRLLSFAALSASGNVDYAYAFLRALSNPSVSDWNAIVRGFSSGRNPEKSIRVFVQMLRSGVSADHMTFPFLAKSCSRLWNRELGGSIHGAVAKTGLEWDLFVCNSLIHMYGSFRDIASTRKLFEEMPVKNLVSWNSMLDGYAKCGDIVSARQVFDEMLERDVVSWSSMVDGYVKSDDYDEALEIFDQMMEMGPKANEVTMVSVFCACAHLGVLDRGKTVHRYVIDESLPLTITLRTSLVDMYAKCGAIEEAWNVFREVPAGETDVLLWNSMIGGLANHGFIRESLELFREMRESGINPDEITFLCLLSACSHGGLVKEAWHFFEGLKESGAEPKSEHYACMVDVLSRAGLVSEAYGFISEMPIEPTASMLGALLSGCINHGNLDLAERVGKRVLEMQPDHDGRYVGLSNVYAIKKRFEDARSMREAMEDRGVKKFAGHSIIELLGTSHRFIAHDKTHVDTPRICSILHLLVTVMKLDDVDVDDDNVDKEHRFSCS
ncbi:PREDICTED: pentatricopeptide repeat-containing protein At5g08305 [Tarenaya hassleriana]|uniref:pentatricopeptide repeat-containing protein At5g08305 n=1 Tax=Tarenaya hassleriana TaxID=28532 RepID=UPI00053C9187|nr:PREDICTED: pentatricopeptide repeat-containing protein At5g08305 [Tarenaya hassleriana]